MPDNALAPLGHYYYDLFLAILIATLVSVVLRRRLRKQRSTVDVAQTAVIFGMAVLTALTSLVLLLFVARQAGVESGKWLRQLIEIASAVIAYLAAGQVLARIRKQRS